jgi:hypothetical protein
VVELIAPPILTAALAVVVAMLHSWRENRDARRRARADLEWATAQLEFVERWLNVQERVASMSATPTPLAADLEASFLRARAGMARPDNSSRRTPSVRQALSRVFLLRRMPGAAVPLRIAYHLSLAFALVWNAAGGSLLSQDGLSAVGQDAPWGASLVAYVLTMALGLVPAVVFFVLTVQVERSELAKSNGKWLSHSAAEQSARKQPARAARR